MADLSPHPSGTAPPSVGRPTRRLVAGAVLLLVVLLVLRLPLPLYVLQPGPVFPLSGVVALEAEGGAAPEPITGDFLFTTIQLDDADVAGVLVAALDGDAQLISRAAVLGGQDEASFIADQEAAFDAAEALAVRLGLEAVGSDVPVDAVAVDAAGVGGPSAGLMIALAVADLASADDLAAGRLVAGTGTVEGSGAVGRVGSIADKVRAAEAAGAVVFLTPAGQVEQARAAARSTEIIGVSTVDEAVEALLGR
jgi:Lon-like protease